MGKFIETTFPTIEERVDRWEIYGLLDRIESNDTKKLVAIALDATAICITELNYLNLKRETKTCLLPVVTRIFRETEEIFTHDKLIKFVKFIVEDFSEKYEKTPMDSNSDESAEFVYQYCKNFKFDTKVNVIEL
jgi:hypothetical protein